MKTQIKRAMLRLEKKLIKAKRTPEQIQQALQINFPSYYQAL